MPDSPNIDQAISRALRANLQGLQRQSEELHQAIADLVASCASSRPANALPPILRAQAAAASLAATLEVLSRFIAATEQSARRSSEAGESVRAVSLPAFEPAPEPVRPAPMIPEPKAAAPISVIPEAPALSSPTSGPDGAQVATQAVPEAVEAHVQSDAAAIAEPQLEPGPFEMAREQDSAIAAPSAYSSEAPPEIISAPSGASPSSAEAGRASQPDSGVVFDVNSLPADLQEMHRRANRVAKVSMQDIEMLKPDQVKLGREHHDLCMRLQGEIEKAHKEYERRFQPILGHGVDYFYHWMVEVLARGDSEALGEYPYSSPALQRQG